MSHIADLRKEYKLRSLSEDEVASDPFQQFAGWWDEALQAQIDEANAMTLATASPDGIPSARIVLLKGFSANGFVFFTNYLSSKGRQIEANPRGCLVFFWKELQRQVRISGQIEKIRSDESDEYFQSRPEGSRIGAWASPQSQVIKNREWLEENESKFKERFKDMSIVRPAYWGGYRLQPGCIEFWQGRPSRLHDRIQYLLLDNGQWKVERLAP